MSFWSKIALQVKYEQVPFGVSFMVTACLCLFSLLFQLRRFPEKELLEQH